MASSAKNYIQLAKSLPEPLQRFFARWPPAAIVPEGTPKTLYQERRANPFEFFKNPATGKMQDPVYSNRRQAQLVKMAREHGVEHLLPESKKGTAYRLAYRVEHGLRVKGTGVGQSVKGHIHERHMIAKMEARRKAMLEMPKLIKTWKRGEMEEIKTPAAVSHYQVLNLTQSLVDSHHNPPTLIKRAYHRALLQNHPDKAARSPASSSTFYSVDQITAAYTVLSSPRDRAAYDASARLSQQQQQHGGGQDDPASVQFRTGVENVDLDDLPFDEGKDVWYRSCRCGNDRGYVFGEDDLEEVGGEGELMVGCLDCSLWLNVHFAQVDNDDTAGTYRSWPLELPTCASTTAGDLPSSTKAFAIAPYPTPV
uniref:Diphthamide biosynthesis protein 4 n=1 Tax=Bionectria ochroleuca TaxID=29856 RepID=A0A0B7JP59_BIOOC